ncbi:MAG: ABC transporter substrate-binding protein [Marinomonas sp.]
MIETDSKGPYTMTDINIGFIPLIDCAPFVIAREKGFFEALGVSVKLHKEASWASIRDKVAFNVLDGAHMLAAMPIATTLGVGAVKTSLKSPIKAPMQTGFTVSQNGNGITVSNSLFQRMNNYANHGAEIRNGIALRRLLMDKPEQNIRFASVFPYSSHTYQLRDWLSRAGIDADKDVQILVIPPTKMISHLIKGEIDGYCVGEPWNSLAVQQGVGHMLMTGYDLWGSTPEKVFAVNSQWQDENQETHLKLINALHQACSWVDNEANQEDLLTILAKPEYLDCDPDGLRYGFNAVKPAGNFAWPKEAYQTFSGAKVNRPNPEYALWLMSQMVRWQELGHKFEVTEVINQVCRQDLYFKALGLVEGEHLYRNPSFNSNKWFESSLAGETIIHPDGLDKGLIY